MGKRKHNVVPTGIDNRLGVKMLGTVPDKILPPGWIGVHHVSGAIVYLHKDTRVVTWSRPYVISKETSLKKHNIPLMSIPCLHQKSALEKLPCKNEGKRTCPMDVQSPAKLMKMDEASSEKNSQIEERHCDNPKVESSNINIFSNCNGVVHSKETVENISSCIDMEGTEDRLCSVGDTSAVDINTGDKTGDVIEKCPHTQQLTLDIVTNTEHNKDNIKVIENSPPRRVTRRRSRMLNLSLLEPITKTIDTCTDTNITDVNSQEMRTDRPTDVGSPKICDPVCKANSMELYHADSVSSPNTMEVHQDTVSVTSANSVEVSLGKYSVTSFPNVAVNSPDPRNRNTSFSVAEQQSLKQVYSDISDEETEESSAACIGSSPDEIESPESVLAPFCSNSIEETKITTPSTDIDTPTGTNSTDHSENSSEACCESKDPCVSSLEKCSEFVVNVNVNGLEKCSEVVASPNVNGLEECSGFAATPNGSEACSEVGDLNEITPLTLHKYIGKLFEFDILTPAQGKLPLFVGCQDIPNDLGEDVIEDKTKFITDGKTPYQILNEFCQKELKTLPTLCKVERLSQHDFTVEISIKTLKYGISNGDTLKEAKHNAAVSTLNILDYTILNEEEPSDYLTIFDKLSCDDKTILSTIEEFSAMGVQYPYDILVHLLKRNFSPEFDESEIEFNVEKIDDRLKKYKIKYKEYEFSGECENWKEGKQLAAQALIQVVYPDLPNWGSVIRLMENYTDLIMNRDLTTEMELLKPSKCIMHVLRQEMRKIAGHCY